MSKVRIKELEGRVSELELEVSRKDSLLAERERVLIFLAEILVQLDDWLSRSKIFPLPRRINVVWVLKNLGEIIGLVKFVYECIQRFRESVKVERSVREDEVGMSGGE